MNLSYLVACGLLITLLSVRMGAKPLAQARQKVRGRTRESLLAMMRLDSDAVSPKMNLVVNCSLAHERVTFLGHLNSFFKLFTLKITNFRKIKILIFKMYVKGIKDIMISVICQSFYRYLQEEKKHLEAEIPILKS